MSILETISAKLPSLSSNEKKIGQFVLDNPSSIENYTMTKIAELTSTSTSAVLRFSQKLGFKGYSEFHYEMVRQLHQESDRGLSNENERFKSLIDHYVSSLQSFYSIDSDLFYQLADKLMNSSAVYCIGIYKSATLADKMAYNLIDLGIRATSVTDMVSLNHLEFIKRPEDVFIYFSISGQSNEAKSFFSSNYEDLENTWLVTLSQRPALQKCFRHTIVIPSVNRYGIDPVDDHVIVMVYIELLTNHLLHMI